MSSGDTLRISQVNESVRGQLFRDGKVESLQPPTVTIRKSNAYSLGCESAAPDLLAMSDAHDRASSCVKCRLLYLVGQLRAGGEERQLFYLLQAMDRLRYNPVVFVWSFTEADKYVQPIRSLGVPIWSFPAHYRAQAKLRTFRRIIGQVRPEVVHSYSFYTNFAAHWASYGTRTVSLGSMQSDFFREKKVTGPFLGRLSARWPATQISNSLRAASNAQSSTSLFVPRTLHVVRNGLDLRLFQSTPIPSIGAPLLLGVGSLFQVKRWDRLVTLAARLKKAGQRFLLRIVGGGPLSATLQELTRNLQVDDRVSFPGHVDDIPGELSNASCLVHTSEVEGCPNVVMEAMASGRAVVAADAGDIGDLVEHGKTGFVVPQGDDAALAHYVTLLLTNAGLCKAMGEAARDKANREFGLERLVSETLAVYKTVGWKD
jgi:glycosyltransferase involved in cell wall biosynthesis